MMGKLSERDIQRLCLKNVIPARVYLDFKILKKKKQTNLRPEYNRTQFTLSRFSDDECLIWFRFTREQIMRLVTLLKVPQKCIAYSKISFSGVEGICILLRRLCYPQRLNDIVLTFNRDPSAISRIFNFMVNWIYKNFAKHVESFSQKYLTKEKLAEMAEHVSLMGCPYPNIIGFIDGTFRASCKPKYNQRDFYSGYYKGHGLKYQAITLPNGLIARMDGGYIARRHDAAIVHISKVVDELRKFLTKADGTWYAVYGDPGYVNSEFIKVGYKNHSRLNQRQKDFNALMSSMRVSVEYGFGGVIQQFAFLDFKKNMKIYMQPVQKMYIVGAFLRNCQCCLRRGNQISKLFDCEPPTLEEYLSI